MRKILCSIIGASVLLAFASSSTLRAQEQPSIPPEAIQQFRAMAQQNAAQAQTRANMRTVQIALEYYATETGGTYPKSILECKPFLDGGSKKIGGTGPDFPTNAFTGATNETPYAAGISSVAQIDKMRKMPPQFTAGKAGQIGYSLLDNGNTYAVIGTDANGNAIANKDGMTLVLSNHE
jgi:hypothetical protein